MSNLGARGDGTHKGINFEYIENPVLCGSYDPARFAPPELSAPHLAHFQRFTARRYLVRRLLLEAQLQLKKLGLGTGRTAAQLGP